MKSMTYTRGVPRGQCVGFRCHKVQCGAEGLMLNYLGRDGIVLNHSEAGSLTLNHFGEKV